MITALQAAIPHRAKWAFTTRNVNRSDAVDLTSDVASAKPGDLVVCQVIRLGSHKRVQLTTGRPSALYLGDTIIVACGARYASDQFEGVAVLNRDSADLLAGGGVVGQMRQRNERQAAPTRVRPIGLLQNANGTILNLSDYRTVPYRSGGQPCPALFVVGTAMNSGKTTATAALAHGLIQAGLKVAAIKATGTGAFGDFNAYRDAGADVVTDFTDTGLVSTYRVEHDALLASTEDLLRDAHQKGCDIAVVELADGIFQQETAAFLSCERVRELANGFVFAAPDAVAVAGGLGSLRQLDIEPLFVTGLVSASPMSATEAAAITGCKVVRKEDLLDPVFAATVYSSVGSVYRPADLKTEQVAA